jgi:hypothetical protein
MCPREGGGKGSQRNLLQNTKKTEEEKAETWHAEKPNIGKILMGG